MSSGTLRTSTEGEIVLPSYALQGFEVTLGGKVDVYVLPNDVASPRDFQRLGSLDERDSVHRTGWT